MTDSAFFRSSPDRSRQDLRPAKAALALGVATLILAGCGGGSDSAETPTTPTPPPSALAAPENFAVGQSLSFSWTPTVAATRYELFVDPDGTGPLPESQVEPQRFSYSAAPNGGSFNGSLGTTVNVADVINASYRLRACNASGCGAFTDAKAFDVTKGISYEFASGYAPLVNYFSAGGQLRTGMLSKDGLTLALRGVSYGANTTTLVFARSSKNQPWQQQASLRSGDYYIDQSMLSADGNTLAVRALKQIRTSTNSLVVTDAVYVYQRSGGAWSQQARLDSTSAPSACPQPCQAEIADHMALSADGNLLAVSAVVSSGTTTSSAVFTYTRTGTAWAPQTSLSGEGTFIANMALSGDGRTLAVTDRDLLKTSATPLVLVFSQDGSGAWTQQERIPATLYVYTPSISGGPEYGAMVLSGDGSTLAVNTAKVSGQVACGASAADNGETQRIALYARTSGAWNLQGQAVVSTGTSRPSTLWALANDGSALIYGSTRFTRSSGTWACN